VSNYIPRDKYHTTVSGSKWQLERIHILSQCDPLLPYALLLYTISHYGRQRQILMLHNAPVTQNVLNEDMKLESEIWETCGILVRDMLWFVLI